MAAILSRPQCVKRTKYSKTVGYLEPLNKWNKDTHKILKSIFINEKIFVLWWKTLKFVPMSLIDNKSSLVSIMAWH